MRSRPALRPSLLWSSFLLWAALAGCSEIPASNPFDPAAPESVQARAEVRGQLTTALEGFEWTDSTAIRLLGEGSEYQASPDAEGTFRIENVRLGLHQLEVESAGHRDFQRSLNLRAGLNDLGPIELVRGDADPEAPKLRGRAHLADQPLEGGNHNGITVHAFYENADDLVATTQTDASGQFVFDAARTNYRLEFYRAGYQSPDELRVVWSESDGRFEVDDEPLAEHPGVVLNADLSARVNGTVVSPLAGFAWDETIVRLDGDGQSRQTTPDAEGAFEFTELRPGLYGLEVDANGHLPASHFIEVEPGPNQPEPVVLVPEFEAPAEAPTLRGLARLSDQPLEDGDHSGVVVHAFFADAEELVATTQTDASGQFAFVAARTDYTLHFSREGYGAAELDVTWSEASEAFMVGEADIGEHPVTLNADLSARVSGTVVSPVAGFRWDETIVRLEGDGRSRQTTPDAEGAFEFIELRPGLYGLEVEANGHLPVAHFIEVEPGENVPAPMVLVPEFEAPAEAPTLRGLARLSDQALEGGDHSGGG